MVNPKGHKITNREDLPIKIKKHKENVQFTVPPYMFNDLIGVQIEDKGVTFRELFKEKGHLQEVIRDGNSFYVPYKLCGMGHKGPQEYALTGHYYLSHPDGEQPIHKLTMSLADLR